MNLQARTAREASLLGRSPRRGIKDSKPTIYRKIKGGKFPRPVYPGKSPAWPEHEIDSYIRSIDRPA